MTRKEFYETLSDELKAKIKACKSEQEMLDVLRDADVELDPTCWRASAEALFFLPAQVTGFQRVNATKP